MDIIKFHFNNSFIENINDVIINTKDDEYTSNFGKQWEKYRDVQIDSKNNFDISYNYLNSLLFKNIDILKDKTILEIGCGAGRFTEYLVKYSKYCVSVDLSSAIFHNISKDENNLYLIKSDMMDLDIKEKFDIVICRGVLQHTPSPFDSILKLHEFVKANGSVFFDIYKTPKLGFLDLKYLFWRPVLKKFIKYDNFDYFLNKNIKKLLFAKRLIKKLFFNSNKISDLILPIYDYKDSINLNEKQLEQWAVLDTMDGIYAKYDYPKKYNNIINLLKKNKIILTKSNKEKNYFMTRIS